MNCFNASPLLWVQIAMRYELFINKLMLGSGYGRLKA